MDCELYQHNIGVNYDADFACKGCGCRFVSDIRADPHYHEYRQKLIRQNLVCRFGTLWKFEWYRLIATKQIIEKIRRAKLTKDTLTITLNMDRVYKLEDFIKPPESLKDYEF